MHKDRHLPSENPAYLFHMLHKSRGKLPLLLAGGAALLITHSAVAAKIKPAAATPAPSASAAPAATAKNEDAAFFKSKVEPILAERCYKCHSNAEGKTKGGLALDSHDAMMKGGDDGKII